MKGGYRVKLSKRQRNKLLKSFVKRSCNFGSAIAEHLEVTTICVAFRFICVNHVRCFRCRPNVGYYYVDFQRKHKRLEAIKVISGK